MVVVPSNDGARGLGLGVEPLSTSLTCVDITVTGQVSRWRHSGTTMGRTGTRVRLDQQPCRAAAVSGEAAEARSAGRLVPLAAAGAE